VGAYYNALRPSGAGPWQFLTEIALVFSSGKNASPAAPLFIATSPPLLAIIDPLGALPAFLARRSRTC
jgi:hypothetical protein